MQNKKLMFDIIKIRKKFDEQLNEFKDSHEELRTLLERFRLSSEKILEKEHKEKVEWIKLYCKEVGIIVDPLDEIFINKK